MTYEELGKLVALERDRIDFSGLAISDRIELARLLGQIDHDTAMSVVHLLRETQQ